MYFTRSISIRISVINLHYFSPGSKSAIIGCVQIILMVLMPILCFLATYLQQGVHKACVALVVNACWLSFDALMLLWISFGLGLLLVC
jgi:hypothetical protein